MTPEYRTIQENISDINDEIANGYAPSVFARKLVDNDFLSQQTADSIQTTGVSDHSKLSRLMQAVDAQIRTASNPTAAFETFIRILRELSLDQLADQLVKFYSKCFGCSGAFFIIYHDNNVLGYQLVLQYTNQILKLIFTLHLRLLLAYAYLAFNTLYLHFCLP